MSRKQKIKFSTQICAAVAAFNKNLVAQVQNCSNSMNSMDKDMANKKNNCTSGKVSLEQKYHSNSGKNFMDFFILPAFASCRLAQRNAVNSVYNCKPGPSGAANKADAAIQLSAATT